MKRLVSFLKRDLIDMPRPQPEYFNTLAACAVDDLGDKLVFDYESECYKEAKAKYRGASGKVSDDPAVRQGLVRKFVKDAVKLGEAFVTAPRVSGDMIQERMATCLACPHRAEKNGESRCGLCGCGLSGDQKNVRNLARYEENLPSWGCKHPKRSEGEGWRR